MAKLQYLKDIQDLNINSINSLHSVQYWKPIEKRLVEQGKAPSLIAYILYEYHFNNQTPRSLANKLETTYQSLLYFMKRTGIPLKTRSEALLGKPSYRKDKTYEEICGIERAKIYKEKISARTKGRTFEKLYGEERAEQMKANLSQKFSGRTPWNKGLTKEDPRVAKYINSRRGKPFGMKGKHHSEETKRKMSEAQKVRRVKLS